MWYFSGSRFFFAPRDSLPKDSSEGDIGRSVRGALEIFLSIFFAAEISKSRVEKWFFSKTIRTLLDRSTGAIGLMA
jgi:hypothetical protein